MEADSAEGSFATPPSLRTDSFCHLALYLQTELEAATAVPGQRDFFYGTVPWLVRLGWGRRRDRASAPSGGAARQPNGLEKDGQACGG